MNMRSDSLPFYSNNYGKSFHIFTLSATYIIGTLFASLLC